jgi:CubicO group peptidase (beta-lactamase class C family)
MKRWACAALALSICSAALSCVAMAQPVAGHAFTAAMAARVDQIGSTEVSGDRTPGAAIAIVEDGRVVYARGFGMANIGKHLRVQPDTEFYIGDLSAQFTFAGVLLLAQDGKLRLDDRIVKYLPELGANGTATIAQLLAQSSGLAPLSADPTHPIKTGDLLAQVGAAKPVAAPGGAPVNNPLNAMLAGIIIERVSGVPLSDYLQQHIFTPLVMNHTFYATDNGISPDHAIGYTRAGTIFAVAKPWDPSALLGARGVVSTVNDLAKWDIAMPILLRVDAMREMFTGNAATDGTSYGMGWVIDQRGGKRFVWLDGQIAGYRSMNAVLPDDHIAAIVLTNADALHGGPVASPEQMASQILDVVAPPQEAHLQNAIVARAQEWLGRLATKQIDRTELTAEFSSYLTDKLVASEDVASYGKLESLVPLSSSTNASGSTVYEFIARYPRAQYHYRFSVAKDGKIDGLKLTP